jgi:hypothetical protein
MPSVPAYWVELPKLVSHVHEVARGSGWIYLEYLDDPSSVNRVVRDSRSAHVL